MNLLLCNTMFDRENDNVLLFNNKEELAQYFENLTNKVIVENVNFNANDLINTSVFVKVGNNLNLFTLLNYNYCVVKQGENLPNLYYFIERSRQDNGSYIKLDLVLDPINTYIYDIIGENILTQGLIQKTHLDRFFKKDNSTRPYYYNFNNDSALFERETTKNVSQRVTQKEKLKIRIDTSGNNIFNDFIANNVAMWKYVFLSKNVEYNFFEFNGETPTVKRLRSLYYGTKIYESIDSNFVVIAEPIMKTGKEIKLTQNNITRTWGGIDYFLSQNNDYANVQAIKYSVLPPLEIRDYTNNFTIDEDGNLIINIGSITFKGIYSDFRAVSNETTSFAFAHIVTQDLINGYELYFDGFLNNTWNFSKEQITNNNEPKILNEDYSMYRLFIGGQQFELPISKTSPRPEFILRETLTPDITKANICFKSSSNPMTNKIFEEITEEDFTGFNLTIDLSMWFPSNALDNYLANNKNYLQIFNNNINNRATKFITDSAYGMAGNLFGEQFAKNPNYAGVAGSGAFSTIAGSSNLLIDTITSRENLNLTIDNMRNAPETTSNINSNPILIYMVSRLNIFIEKLELLPFEKSVIVDNLKMFGYNYNKIGYLNNFIKTRKYYNYIQGIIYDIDAQIAEQVKDKIKEIFKNGVRFWHADAWKDITQLQIDFNVNNIERSIDNE